MILPANIRDLSYVAANMRAADWREISCQIPTGTTPLDVAVWSLSGRESWVAMWRDQPVAALGVHDVTAAGNVLSVWCWGTRRMWRVVPEISRWFRAAGGRWIAEGVTRVEARSIVGHHAAHRWMRRLGAAEEPLPAWGRDGENFVLFSWTREGWMKREGDGG